MAKALKFMLSAQLQDALKGSASGLMVIDPGPMTVESAMEFRKDLREKAGGARLRIVHNRTARAAMQSLDEQVQEIKSDVLAIAAELGNLEEKLLYPSTSQVAVFVSLEEGDSLGLDSVQISIDGELVAHHIYSFKELQAMRKGGVQRIYTGNVRTGKHKMEVSIAATTTGGKDIGQHQSFEFTKEVDPKLVGITLASQATGDATIAVGGW